MTDAELTARILTLAEVEAQHIRAVMYALKGNKTAAAKALGVDRRTLYRKLERLPPDTPTCDAPPAGASCL